MLIRSDVGSTHDQHHHIGKDRSMVIKVNRDSHLIKKPPSPPLTPTSKTHRPPVIIYAHAPRVIHTKPQEFKALVQTLTGYTENKDTTTTKNEYHPPPSHIPPPTNIPPMYYDFDEFETKNVLPLTNNNPFSINDLKHNSLTMEDNMSISCVVTGGLDGDGEYFAPPIFDLPTLPFFAPDQLCYTSNNFNTSTNNNNNKVGFIGTVSSKINKCNTNNNMFYNQNCAEIGNVSGCYDGDGASSPPLMLSSSPSSVEEVIDELTDFSDQI